MASNTSIRGGRLIIDKQDKIPYISPDQNGFLITKKGGGVMKSIYIFLFALIVGLTLGCASSQDKAYKAEEKVHNERLKLVEEYQQCLKEAGDDKLKSEACEQYLKAAEALK